MSGAKAYIHPVGAQKPADLCFVQAGNWWNPPKVHGPPRAQFLFAKQMAVDFVDFTASSLHARGDELSRVIRAMPRKHGIVERTFLEYVGSYAAMCARAMK